MLTQKHFVAIVEILKKRRNNERYKKTVDRVMYDLAAYFVTQNPYFDWERFKAAYEEDK